MKHGLIVAAALGIIGAVSFGIWWHWYRYEPVSTPTNRSPAANPENDPTVVAAGDIADCGSSGDEATARLVENTSGPVLTLGDHVYPLGGVDEFEGCYGPSWGRFRERTRPVPGNHDYLVPQASAYFAYFGAAAGDPAKGYYSYDVGEWHVVALNSNCGNAGGCGESSPQVAWLRADLAGHPNRCTLAAMHHPRFSSGQHGSDAALDPLWQTLIDGGVDVVLAGHDHLYERLAPLDRNGNPAANGGTRAFIVGTGGKNHYTFHRPLPTSEARDNTSFGVLQLTLHAASYDWSFMSVDGATFRDAGTEACS